MSREGFAKIGRKYPGRDPLRLDVRRAYLRALAKWMLIVLALMTVAPAVLWVAVGR